MYPALLCQWEMGMEKPCTDGACAGPLKEER